MSMRAGARIASLAVLTACCALGLGSGLATPAQAGSEHITSYLVDVVIESGGTVRIQETISYDFGADRRHGIYRDLPDLQPVNAGQDREFPISGIRVSSRDGTPDRATITRGGGSLHIRIGNPKRTITGSHTYLITYLVRRALTRVAGHAEFSWNLVGDSWPVPISGITARVRAPAGITSAVCFAGPAGSRAHCGSAARSGPAATFRQAFLGPGEGLTVQVEMPSRSVTMLPALIVPHWTLGAAVAPTLAGAAAGTGVLIAVAAWLLVPRRWRSWPWSARADPPGADSPAADSPAAARPYAPFSGLRPGQAGLILVGAARPAHVVATVVDLAIRGYLRIEEAGEHQDEWVLIRLDPVAASPGDARRRPPRLLRYERTVLAAVFARQHRVSVRELKDAFPPVMTRVSQQLTRDAVRRGWLSPRRRPAAGGALVASGAVLFLTGVLPGLPHGLAFFALTVMLAGTAIVLTARRDQGRETWTPEGARLRASIQHFRKKLRRLKPASDDPWAGFAGKLPYAITFGLVAGWVDRFATVTPPVAEPSWWTCAGPQPAISPYYSVASFTTTMCSYAPPPPAQHLPAQDRDYGGYGGYGYGAGAGSGGGMVGGGGGGGGGGSW